jgi:hypothetical protein
MTAPQNPALSDALQYAQKAIEADDGQDPGKHADALEAIARLQLAAERPDETIMRLRWGFYPPFAMRFCVEYGVIQKLAETSGKDMTSKELAAFTGAEELLLLRVMRLLTYHGVVDEVDHGVYAANEVTAFLARPGIIGGLKHLYDHGTKIVSEVPELIERQQLGTFKTGRSSTSPLQHVFGKTMFPWLAANPPRKRNFDNYMQARQHSSEPKWFDIYDVESELAANPKLDTQEVLLVDVGGGKGHDVAKFADRFPNLPGKLVLQDLPQTFESGLAVSSEKADIMGHDFFTEQPVKGRLTVRRNTRTSGG